MNREDLSSLALVNHLFFDTVDCRIWRDVTFRFTRNSSPSDMERRLRTLLSKVEQGRVVTNLQFHVDSLNAPEIDRFRICFGELLTRLSGLKSLTLADGRDTFVNRQSGICPSFHLVELHIHFAITSKHWDLIFAQPTIRRLSLNSLFGTEAYCLPDIPINALPQLEALSARFDIVEKLLPGRPVKYFATTFPDFEQLGCLVKKSTVPLTALSVGLYYGAEALLQKLADQTPCVSWEYPPSF